MNIGFTPEERDFRTEVIDFLTREITPEFTAEFEKEDAASSYSAPEFSRKLAAKGWLTLHWPKEYGGQERPIIYQAIVNEQLGYFRAPVGWHNISTEWVAMPIMVSAPMNKRSAFYHPLPVRK